MIQIRRSKVFKPLYAVTDSQGFVSEWRGRFGREGASGVLDGQELKVRKDGRKRFVLEGGGRELASVERASRSGRRWTLFRDGRSYEMVKRSVWRSTFELRSGEGAALGTISRKRRNVIVDLPDELPASAQAFLGFVAMAVWDREAAASSGGVVAATS